MSDIQISIHHKSYRNSQLPVINSFRLSLKSGEFVCLLGQSGCGKTTLLNCIAGLDHAYTGEVSLGDRHTRPKIGYIFQNPRLLPWRTVRENISLVLPSSEPESNSNLDALLSAMQLLRC